MEINFNTPSTMSVIPGRRCWQHATATQQTSWRQCCCGLPQFTYTHMTVLKQQAFGNANEPWPTTSHSSFQPCLFTTAIFLIVMYMEVCLLNDFLALIQVNPKFPARDKEVLKTKTKQKPSKPIPLCVESIAIAEQLHPYQVLWKVSLLTDRFIWYVS